VYGLYVIWVFVGDEWHERGRPQPDLQGGWTALQDTLGIRWAPAHRPPARPLGQRAAPQAWAARSPLGPSLYLESLLGM
jgi:hypothetical protein